MGPSLASSTDADEPLPERIRRLPEIARDLRWTWNRNARDVFRQLDYQLWRTTAHNPVHMLRVVGRARLEDAAADAVFLASYDQALAQLNEASGDAPTWWSEQVGEYPGGCIAYFSAEFALHQSLPIYAGGLGVLAGDICKEASDLGMPLVGVGFMYPQGYFHQQIGADGWQREEYERLNWDTAPIEPATMTDGSRCIVEVPLGNRAVRVGVWRVRLGRTKLYLLDTGLEENDPWDRELSARLYGGDHETRVQQEVILGVGGVRALRALGSDPVVWHLNEGHAAFVALERIQELLAAGHGFDDALSLVKQTTVFTTHTPVPAGHDAFSFHLVETHLAGCWGPLGTHRRAFLALGHHDSGSGPLFNMTALALRTASHINAVSHIHSRVTRDMWAPVWPETSPSDATRARDDPTNEADRGPLRTITNGVHVRTWVAREMARLFDRYLGPNWRDRHDDPALWDSVADIPNHELWATRCALRTYLCAFIRERVRARWTAERAGPGRVVAGGTLLNPAALTIGFARRFTAYKRPELVFQEFERLATLLNASRTPVQIVFAGKAHPADEAGKRLLQQVYQAALDPALGGRIAFVDDYDLHVAHFIVQGCDVWLNTPRKPMEASGTSGMKASINGAPHLSVGDGWWTEGYTGQNGWLVHGATLGDPPEVADRADAQALYRLLEEQVIPTFYERDEDDIPTRWLTIVREAIRTVAPHFSARRMVKQYVQEMYRPALDQARSNRSAPSSKRTS